MRQRGGGGDLEKEVEQLRVSLERAQDEARQQRRRADLAEESARRAWKLSLDAPRRRRGHMSTRELACAWGRRRRGFAAGVGPAWSTRNARAAAGAFIPTPGRRFGTGR